MKIKILSALAVLSAMMFAGCDVNEPIYDATYTIAVSNDGHGTGAAKVGDASADKCVAGATVTLAATPAADYRFKQWTVVSGNVTLAPNVTTNPATFTMPLENVEIRAEFEFIPAFSVSPDSDQNVSANVTSFQFDITSNTAWECLVNGVKQDEGTGEKAVTVTFPANGTPSPIDIGVKFTTVGLPTEIVYDVKITQAGVPTYAITLSNNGNGTVTAYVGGAAATSAVAGKTVTIIATPANQTDYEFKQWIVVHGGSDAMLSSTTTNSATFIMPAGAVEIRAEFQPTVTYVNTFLAGATIVCDAGASDADKTVYTFMLPNAPVGAEIGSAAVTSASAYIGSSVGSTTIVIASNAMQSAVGPDIKVQFSIRYQGVNSTDTGTLTVPFTGAARNHLGGVYYKEGVAQGVVYVSNNGITPGTGRVVTLAKMQEPWALTDLFIASTADNGRENMKRVKLQGEYFTYFPAFALVDAMNGAQGSTDYTSDATGIWYIPAIDELKHLYNVWNSDRDTFNNCLIYAGGVALTAGFYFSSTETVNANPLVQSVDFNNGGIGHGLKYNSNFVRCIFAF